MSLPTTILLALALFASTPAYAQAFDVVSIKPSDPNNHNMQINMLDDRFEATNFDLTNLLAMSTGVHQHLIEGLPDWSQTEHFDLAAKVSDPDPAVLKHLTDAEAEARLYQVLVDRFKLKAHHETRTGPVFNLTVIRSGPKPLTPGEPEPRSISKGRPGAMELRTSTIANLIFNLTTNLHQNVLDKTNLIGKYDLHLTWNPDFANPDTAPANSLPSLADALQDQLNLKLVPSKGPVDVLVVDHIEHPTPN